MSEARRSARIKPCPHCGGTNVYSRQMPAGGGDGLYLLAGLGDFLHYAEVEVVLCADCGLLRLFAEPAACENVRSSPSWQKR